MILLLVFTDGRRDCISHAVPSLHHLEGPITDRIIYDDSGDENYRAWLRESFPEFRVMYHHSGHRQGFGGAIQSAWEYLFRTEESSPERFIFSTEDDFVLTRTVNLRAMMAVLDDNHHLAQLALRRQPWNESEKGAGGIVEQAPSDYSDCFGPAGQWLEHRRFYTTNPSLIRRSLCRRGWPTGAQSEGHFSAELFRDPEARCGFWGARDSGEWCTHIGHERVGVGY